MREIVGVDAAYPKFSEDFYLVKLLVAFLNVEEVKYITIKVDY